MSSPCSAAGSRPTADSSLVRPPTQSHIGNRASQPSAVGGLVQLRAGLVTATACVAKSRPGGLVGVGDQQHAVARLRRAAALGGDDARASRGSRPAELAQHAVDAVRVGVVDEVDPHPVGGRVAQRVGHELRPERRAADADAQHAGEPRRRRRPDLPAVDAGGERLDVGDGLADLGGDLRRRGQLRASAASSGRPSGSRPGWRSRPSPARPSPRTPAARAGSMRSRKPSSNPIRLTSSVRPSDGTRQRYCWYRCQSSCGVHGCIPRGSSAHLAGQHGPAPVLAGHLAAEQHHVLARLGRAGATWPSSIAKASSCSADAASGRTSGVTPQHSGQQSGRPARSASRPGSSPSAGGCSAPGPCAPSRWRPRSAGRPAAPRPGRRRPPWPR